MVTYTEDSDGVDGGRHDAKFQSVIEIARGAVCRFWYRIVSWIAKCFNTTVRTASKDESSTLNSDDGAPQLGTYTFPSSHLSVDMPFL